MYKFDITKLESYRFEPIQQDNMFKYCLPSINWIGKLQEEYIYFCGTKLTIEDFEKNYGNTHFIQNSIVYRRAFMQFYFHSNNIIINLQGQTYEEIKKEKEELLKKMGIDEKKFITLNA